MTFKQNNNTKQLNYKKQQETAGSILRRVFHDWNSQMITLH